MITRKISKDETISTRDALEHLRPQSLWVLRGDDLEWLDTEQVQPTDAEITAEVTRLQSEYDNKEYQRLRVAEYPSMADYIDGIVKGDTEQVQTYIDACLAVKTKYPKPD